jgi:hypothetical protein
MKPTERRAYWRQVTRMQLKLQRKYSEQIKEALDTNIDKFIERFKEVGTVLYGDIELFNEDLFNVYKRMYRETVVQFANVQYKRLAKFERQKNMGFNQQWTNEVNEWLGRYGLEMVSTVTGNERERMLEIINRAIQEGVSEGYGIDVVTNNILSGLRQYQDTNRYIAERIARTETMRAANIGHMKGAEAHGFEVRKEWISAKDNRTRRYERDDFDHWVLDGQQREMNEAFMQVGIKSGKVAMAQQPGDGPAAFTINCRCTIAFEPKRDAQGKLIRKR